MIDNYVGARRIDKCKCIYCRECLIHKDILFSPDDIITPEQAKLSNLRCSHCGALLYIQAEDYGITEALNSEAFNISY